MIQICDEIIWNSAEEQDKAKKLNTCLNSFTRSGVGKFTANLVSDAILNEIELILAKPPFTFHSDLKGKIFSAAETYLKKKCTAAMEQVENSMKPYKQGIEFTPRDWRKLETNYYSFWIMKSPDSNKKLPKLNKILESKG